MKSRFVYGIFADDYEGSFVQATFETRPDANRMLARVKAYDLTRPQLPEPSDTDDGEFEKAWRRLERWRGKHPLGKGVIYSSGYDFNVQKIRFYPAVEVDHG